MANTANNMLIIGPSWVGDMVMAQSLFITLKQQNPAMQIDVLAPAWTQPLLDRMPEINQAISMPIAHGQFSWSSRKQLGQQLKEHHYDQAIILPNSWKSALIPWFAKIPVRTGWLGEMRYGLLNDARKLDKAKLPLMVQRFVSLAHPKAQSKQAPDYPLPKMVAKPIDHALLPKKENDQKRIVLCPGAEFGPAKQWPVAHYAAVASAMIDAGWQVLILGSKADQETGQAITSVVKTHSSSQLFNLCGQTQLNEAIDILATADQVISNDSGLMHIAAALQKPLIALYGATSPEFTPPLSDNAKILQETVDCGPCFQRTCPEQHHKCMQQLSSQHVIQLIMANH